MRLTYSKANEGNIDLDVYPKEERGMKLEAMLKEFQRRGLYVGDAVVLGGAPTLYPIYHRSLGRFMGMVGEWDIP